MGKGARGGSGGEGLQHDNEQDVDVEIGNLVERVDEKQSTHMRKARKLTCSTLNRRHLVGSTT